MPRHRVGFEISRIFVAGVVGLSTAACSGTIPHHGTSALLTTPSPSTVAEGAGLAGATSAALGRDGVSFTLVNGTFTLTSEDSELTGTYGGVVTAPTEGQSKVEMSLVVTGGSDSFAGATGTLVGDGRGAILVDGRFVLSLSGLVETAEEPSGFKFHATVAGTATLPFACSANGRRISRLEGEGTMATVGKVQTELESEILETDCL
jgi:hypothetical protein